MSFIGKTITTDCSHLCFRCFDSTWTVSADDDVNVTQKKFESANINFWKMIKNRYFVLHLERCSGYVIQCDNQFLGIFFFSIFYTPYNCGELFDNLFYTVNISIRFSSLLHFYIQWLLYFPSLCLIIASYRPPGQPAQLQLFWL